GLPRILRAEARVEVNAPLRPQVLHCIAIDLGERRVALVVEIAAVGDPGLFGLRGELLLRESGRRFDGVRRVRGSHGEKTRNERNDDPIQGAPSTGCAPAKPLLPDARKDMCRKRKSAVPECFSTGGTTHLVTRALITPWSYVTQ